MNTIQQLAYRERIDDFAWMKELDEMIGWYARMYIKHLQQEPLLAKKEKEILTGLKKERAEYERKYNPVSREDKPNRRLSRWHSKET